MVMTIDPTSSAWHENPYPSFDHARRFTPVAFQPETASWSIFRYSDVHAILRDAAHFSSDFKHAIPPRKPRLLASMLTADPPRHTHLRELANRAFTPRMVAALEPRAQSITNGLLDAVTGTESTDLIEDLAIPLPVMMIAEILGAPTGDRAQFRRWSDEMIVAQGTGGARRGYTSTPDRTLAELSAYFTDIAEQRCREPREDLISALLVAEIEGSQLSMDELVSFCVLLLVAGNETTTNLIGNAVRCLLEHPTDFDRLRSDPSLWPLAIEEVLRYRSPVHSIVRLPLEPVELRGETIEAGQPLVLWLSSANRDPEEFGDPDRFTIERQPNRHLAFGYGIHFCLGAPLARLEANVALRTLARRLPNLRHADDSPYEPVPGYIMQGVSHMRLRFTPTTIAR